MAEADNESENFFHLVKLIVDVGSEVLRDVLLHIIKPDTLDNVLQINMPKIDNLQRRKILFVNEYNVLTEKPPNSDKFDITLLVKLFRNLCPSICPHVISPKYVWGQSPGPNDFRLEDDIQRLREIRNAIFAHMPNTKVTDNEFQKHWVNITDAITRAAVYGSQGMKQRAKDKMDAIRTENVKSSNLKYHLEVFRAWYEADTKFENIEKQLKQQGDAVSEQATNLTQLDKKMQGLEEKVGEIAANLPSISEKQSITDTEESQLQQYLIDGYKQKLEVTLLPQWEQLQVSEIFTPSILVCDEENKTHKEEEFRNLETYRQLFYKNDVLQKRVILLGEAGTGKTTFSKHLTDAWCETTTQTQFADVDVLKQFHYLFYVSCRFAEEKETLLDMINNQLFTDGRMKEVALYMLQNYPECCLIVLDGADEWKGSPTSETGRRGDITGLPSMTGVEDCLILITSRPWRFHSLPTKAKDIFRRLEINGVKDVKKLALRILQKLEDPNPEQSTKDFVHQVEVKNMLELMKIPLILIISLGGWVGDKSLHRSVTLNYINMILSFIRRVKGQADWSKGKQLSSKLDNLESEWEQKAHELPELLLTFKSLKRYAGLFLLLGQLAFNLLLEKEEQSLVFSKQEFQSCLSADEENDESLHVCLALGILSKTETTTHGIIKLQSYAFCHKTFQEFFAALWLVSKYSNENSKLYKCIKSYSDLMSYEILIRFLCGLGPEAGKLFWKFIAEEDQVMGKKEQESRYVYYYWMKKVTALVCNCMKEHGCDPKDQKSDQIYFCIPHISTDMETSDENMILLSHVMEKYPDNVKSLVLTYVTMTNLLLPVEGTRMTTLWLVCVTMTHHGYEQLAESLLSNSSLENLYLYRVLCTDHGGACCIPVLDLQKHNKLKTLELSYLSVAGLLLPVEGTGMISLELKDVTMTHHGCEQLAKSLLSYSESENRQSIIYDVKCREHNDSSCQTVENIHKIIKSHHK